MSDHGDALFLGIDVGTGSSKAVLADAAGTVIDSARIAHDISLPRPDWAEFDAEGVGWAEVQRLSAELLSRHDRARLAGVCVSAMGPCLVITDDQLHPLRPTILYGIDARAGQEIRELTELIGNDALLAEGGKLLSAQAVGPKLRWISRHEQDVWRRASQWHSLSSYLVAKLAGEHVLDHHTASQCDPMYDLAGNRWHPERTALLTQHLASPRLAWPAEVVGHVHAAAAKATGIPQGVPVCAGTVDAWAEALSAGVRRPGDLLLMYGSTMFFVKVIDDFAVHDKLWTTAGVEPGTLTVAAGMSTSGSLLEWMQRLFGNVPFEALLAEAEATPPGADGLLVLPYFAGERTPVFDPDARGLIIGLTLRHDRGHLYRATHEGIAFGIRQIVDLLDGIGQPIERIRAVGGGTQARLWLQIVSDITGRRQEVPDQTIGASYGDALLAAIGTGSVPVGTDWAVPAQLIEPDPERSRIYERLFTTYGTLYAATAGQVHALARMQAADQ
jgi:xylulokinase